MCNFEKPIIHDYQKEFLWHVGHNDFKSAQQVLSKVHKRKKEKLSPNIFYRSFELACKNNNIEMAEWITKLNRKIFNNFQIELSKYPFFRIKDRFAYCVSKLQCIHTKKTFDLTKTKIEVIFICACYHGDFSSIRKILSKNPQINVSYYKDAAFRILCAMDHIHIAQWLYKKYPTINITADNNYAIKTRELRVMQWLQSIHPRLYQIQTNKNKISINFHYDRHYNWLKKMYILWLSSSISPNKNSIIYLLPSDLIRFIFRFIG